MQYTAVILAAGYGSRIQELTKEPKSFSPIKFATSTVPCSTPPEFNDGIICNKLKFFINLNML